MNCTPHRTGFSKSPRASRIKLVICECSWCTIHYSIGNPIWKDVSFWFKGFKGISLYISSNFSITRSHRPKNATVFSPRLPVDHRQDVSGVDDDGLPLVYSVERTLGRSREKTFRIFRSSERIIPIINEHYGDWKHDLGPQKVAEVLGNPFFSVESRLVKQCNLAILGQDHPN